MLRFLFLRTLSALLILGTVATFSFLGLRLLPGGPFDVEAELSAAVQKNMEQKYGLQKSLISQYFIYMGGLLHGDLGVSYQYEGRPVALILGEALPVSLTMGLLAFLLAMGLGVPLGAWAAARQGSFGDRWVRLFAMAGVSVPSFLVGPLLILVFSFGWPWNHWLPPLYQWLDHRGAFLPSALWLSPVYWVLPIATLTLRPLSFIIRLTRASVLDQFKEEFVRTAKAKGLGEAHILFRHILKSAVVPILAYGGPLIAGLLSGSFVVEVIFAVPGIAKYFVQSVFYRDYPMVMGLTLVFSILLIIGNFLTDALYRWVDPRAGVS